MDIRVRIDVEVRMVFAEEARYGRVSARAAKSKASRRRRGQVTLPSDRIDRRRHPEYRSSRVRKGVLLSDGTIVWVER